MSVSNKISRLYIMAYPVVISDLQFCVAVSGVQCVRESPGGYLRIFSMLNLIIAISQFFFFVRFHI